MIFCLKRFFFLEKFGIIFMKEKIKKRVKLRVKIYSVYIVFEDDSGSHFGIIRTSSLSERRSDYFYY